MADTIKVGIVGDYNPGLRFHAATNEALSHSAQAMAVALDVEWLSRLLSGSGPPSGSPLMFRIADMATRYRVLMLIHAEGEPKRFGRRRGLEFLKTSDVD